MGSTDEFLVGGWWRNGNCTLLRRVPPEDPLSSLAPAPGHTALGRGSGAHLIALFDGVIVWVLRVQHRVAGGIHPTRALAMPEVSDRRFGASPRAKLLG